MRWSRIKVISAMRRSVELLKRLALNSSRAIVAPIGPPRQPPRRHHVPPSGSAKPGEAGDTPIARSVAWEALDASLRDRAPPSIDDAPAGGARGTTCMFAADTLPRSSAPCARPVVAGMSRAALSGQGADDSSRLQRDRERGRWPTFWNRIPVGSMAGRAAPSRLSPRFARALRGPVGKPDADLGSRRAWPAMSARAPERAAAGTAEDVLSARSRPRRADRGAAAGARHARRRRARASGRTCPRLLRPRVHGPSARSPGALPRPQARRVLLRSRRI